MRLEISANTEFSEILVRSCILEYMKEINLFNQKIHGYIGADMKRAQTGWELLHDVTRHDVIKSIDC